MKNILLISFVFLAACGTYESDIQKEVSERPGYGKKFFYLEAPCEINVEDIGTVNIEDEYIAGVIACENPHAPFEALKAQAVEARSFLYYKKFIEGKDTVKNSQADQVFRCSHAPNGPNADHKRAATETRGQYLSWKNEIVASFFVAGSTPANPDSNDPFNSCKVSGEDSSSVGTQKWVTYNKGKSGCDVELTKLGLVPDDCNDNPQNRGAASQNGHACLATAGVKYDDQFAMYYGEDIKLTTATGVCGSDAPTDKYDAFCDTKPDDTYCFDNLSTIVCSENLSEKVEECENGCSDAECIVPVVETFCTGKANGNYCDNNQSIVCANEVISSTTPCSAQCTGGLCKTEDGKTDPNFCVNRPSRDYCDSDTLVSCSNRIVSATQECKSGCDDSKCNDLVNEDDGALITISKGIVGGCSTLEDRPSFFLFFLVGCFLLRRKK